MDPASSASSKTDDYLYLDPRAPRGSRPPTRKTGCNEATVFVIGGGNYYEYGNLQEWASRQQQKRIVTYGTTDIVNANTFLHDLALLGK